MDPGQHALVAAGHAGDAGEDLGVDRVHADGNAVQAGGGERRGQRLQQMAIGGEGDVERMACLTGGQVGPVGVVGGAHLGERGNHLHQAGAQEGFAAGEADFLDAEGDEDPHHAEVVGDGALGVLRAFVAGAAVDALVVAAVGDGDAEVGDRTAEGVAQARPGCHRSRVCRRRGVVQLARGGVSKERRWEQGSDLRSSDSDWMSRYRTRNRAGANSMLLKLPRTGLNSV